MIYKDTVILNFYFDRDDPNEQKAFEQLLDQLDKVLLTKKLGKLDDYSYDVKGGSFKINLLGYNAETMLEALGPIIRHAAFLIGPKATLIMRGFANDGRAVIKHVDL